MYYLKLNNSILGWMLVPTYRHSTEGVYELLDLLHGQEWAKIPSGEKAFMKGEPVENAVAHIKEVCKSCGVRVSICGNRKTPTLRIWWNKTEALPVKEVSVDLKWSCWINDRGIWDEYAPGVWASMEAAFKGEDAAITVSTGPRKEIRYGCVTISKGRAEGWFSSEWDEVESLAETLGTKCDMAFREMIPHSSHMMEPGTDWEFKVKARSFATLMRKIDAEEDALLQHDREEWDSIKACFPEVAAE